MLLKNKKLNKCTNIKSINKGIGGKNGSTKIYIDNNPARNSLYLKTNKYETIKIITLKEIFKENKINRIDYLKIDCEGAEFEIIKKCPAEYLSKIKYIKLTQFTPALHII